MWPGLGAEQEDPDGDGQGADSRQGRADRQGIEGQAVGSAEHRVAFGRCDFRDNEIRAYSSSVSGVGGRCITGH